jgi:hypothetical protein
LLLSLLLHFWFYWFRFFSLFILVRFARGLSILFIFSKNQLFISLILCILFVCFYFINFSPYFSYFSPSACFGFCCSCFSRSLRCSIKSLIWALSVLLIYALLAINFLPRTAFAVSHRFW